MRFGILWNIIKDTYIFILLLWLIMVIILKGHRHYKIYLTISAVVYVAVLLYVTLLGRTAGTEYQMELSFLWEYRLALQGNVSWWMQIFDNIMLFVPMGWLYGGLREANGWLRANDRLRDTRASGRTMQKKTTWIGTIAFGLCASLFIELCQLVFKLGLFELDDILNNTVGMMVGYGIYRWFALK